MPIYPRPEQIQALLKSDFEGPVDMLNLLIFKERAEYEDGRETNLTGQEAYALYGEKMMPFVASHGGKFLYGGAARHLMIGDGDLEWDSVAVMQYPSKEAFVKIATAPEVAEFGVHRTAGLAHQLLVACSGTFL
ncbi:MAG: DUF1330 domain-containing protein [bacterium]|nr:DUF1330 domain-containing protein [bacterium]